ncbi:MAG TPA: hypothetical protein PK689_07210, partial [Kiritimatiellia bacterium]|nr:hypothetical protein [Kiritimatiellia bacterium]
PGLLLACLVFLRFLFSCLAVPWGSNSFGCGFAALWPSVVYSGCGSGLPNHENTKARSDRLSKI